MLSAAMRSTRKFTYSPYLDRTAMKGREAIVSQMADDMRLHAANAGSVTERDLELIGWTAGQVETYGRDASRLATSQATWRR